MNVVECYNFFIQNGNMTLNNSDAEKLHTVIMIKNQNLRFTMEVNKEPGKTTFLTAKK